jgi:hypothetical protein
MSEKSGWNIVALIAHIQFVVAQVYLGLYVILMVVPLGVFFGRHRAWTPDGELFRGLLWSFPEFWLAIFKGLSGASFALLVFLVFPLGFILSELSFRFGMWAGYHDAMDLESDGYSSAHFKFRSKLLASDAEFRIWEWQNLQFNLCYYSEVLFFLFSVALTFSIVFPFAYLKAGGALVGSWFFATLCLLLLSVVAWLLVRVARKQKLADFRSAHAAAKALLFLGDPGSGSSVKTEALPEADG